MTEPAPEREPTALRIVVPLEPGDTPALYTNFVQLTFTPYDFTLHLGWHTFPPFQEPLSGGEYEVPVRPLAKVSIPLNLVRAIRDVFDRQIAAWEEAFGETLPDQPSPAQPERERGATR